MSERCANPDCEARRRLLRRALACLREIQLARPELVLTELERDLDAIDTNRRDQSE